MVSLSVAWTRFKDLLQKVPHHQIFYDHVSFCLKREINPAVDGKLRDKSAEESWKIIENLALYDNENSKRKERFEEAIYQQREEINERMTEMFCLIEEYTKGKSLEKVLAKEEVNKPVTKYINAIYLVRMKNEKDGECNEVIDKNVVE
ncbi:hypothetical protein Tco_1333669 [Tanacetum coccineum]